MNTPLTPAPLPVLAAEGMNPLEHVLPHTIFHVGSFAVSNLLIMGTFAAVVMLLVFMAVAKKVAIRGSSVEDHVTHGRVSQLFETICAFLRDSVAKPNLGDLTDKYIYYIWTVFFFILFCNVLGMIPFGSAIAFCFHLVGKDPGVWGHLGGTATANLSLNAPLALCSLIAVIFIGVREAGKHFFQHFAPVPFKPLTMAPIAVMMVVMEIMSLLIRCAVLAMRLFGTMVAGHLVLAALVGMIMLFGAMSAWLGYGVGLGVVVLNLCLSLLELFIALLQAFIFTFLTVLFIAMGAVTHDDHAHEPHPESEIEHTDDLVPGV